MSEAGLPIDQTMKVTLSDDKLSAYLQLLYPEEGITCTTDDLEMLLKRCGITHGLHYDQLSKLASKPLDYVNTSLLVATGSPAKNGKDGSISFKYDLDNDMRKPQEMEDGTVDLKEVNALFNVQKGEVIASRTLPTDGTPGIAVTGEAIAPKRGKEIRFKLGKNVHMDPEELHLFAGMDGMISRTDRNKINVFPVYEINGDVDFRVGNIDFVGSVVIRGSVLSGFRIKASGDIRITGGVEGAELLADGSIEVSGGVLGHGKGYIKAGKNVRCSFVQEGNIEAGEDILITQSVMHSNIRAGRAVICKGSKGLIVGGIVQAGERVIARTIGNSMSTGTIIEVGALPEHRNEMIELRTSLRTAAENLKKTDQALGLLDQLAGAGQLSSDKIAMRIKLAHSKKLMVESISGMKERIMELETLLENVDNASIEVASMIYGGVKMVMGRYTKFIKDTTPRVHFRILEGDIVMLANRA